MLTRDSQYRYRDSNPGFRHERAIECLPTSAKVVDLQRYFQADPDARGCEMTINVRQEFGKRGGWIVEQLERTEPAFGTC